MYTWGPTYGSECLKLMFVNFVDDVTLADEETNSIPTDDANRAIQGKWQSKWCDLVANFATDASCDGDGNVLFIYALCKLYFSLCTAAHLMPLQLSFQSVKAQHPLPPSQSIPLLKKLLKAQVCFKKTARKALKLEAMTVAHPVVLTVPLFWKSFPASLHVRMGTTCVWIHYHKGSAHQHH